MRNKQPKKVRELTIEEMLDLRRQGVTLRELGDRLGISKQRVQQILGYSKDLKPKRIVLTKEEKAIARRERYIQKFWSRVDIRSEDDCWNWKAGMNPTTGYGQACFNGKKDNAHRVAYIITNGEIPSDSYVLHSCDNRLCVNLKHLRIGTQQDNIDDRENRGRGKSRNGTGAYYRARNRNIIKDYKSPSDIATLTQKYGVCPTMIYRIVLNHKHDPLVYDDNKPRVSVVATDLSQRRKSIPLISTNRRNEMAPNAYTKNGTKITPDNLSQLLDEAHAKLKRTADTIVVVPDAKGNWQAVYPKKQTK